jgi:hypothetical protein
VDAPQTPSLEQLEPQRSATFRRARWLLLAVMVLAFLGGSCALQEVMPASTSMTSIPTKAEYLRRLNDTQMFDTQQVSPEQLDAMAEASVTFLKGQQAVRKRFSTPLSIFSLFLVGAYMALFFLASRTWRFGNQNVVRLSQAALVALVARVGCAAVELAGVVQLRPLLEAFIRELSFQGASSAPVTGDTLLEMGSLLGNGAGTAYLVLFWVKTIAVALLLYAAHSYFARPDVQAFFVREDPQALDRDDNDDD